jgi:hypothetical protein
LKGLVWNFEAIDAEFKIEREKILRGSSTGQVLGLLSNGYDFESSQSH